MEECPSTSSLFRPEANFIGSEMQIANAMCLKTDGKCVVVSCGLGILLLPWHSNKAAGGGRLGPSSAQQSFPSGRAYSRVPGDSSSPACSYSANNG